MYTSFLLFFYRSSFLLSFYLSFFCLFILYGKAGLDSLAKLTGRPLLEGAPLTPLNCKPHCTSLPVPPNYEKKTTRSF